MFRVQGLVAFEFDADCGILNLQRYRGTPPTSKRTPLGPYRRPVPRVLGGISGGLAFYYGRGTPVHTRQRSMLQLPNSRSSGFTRRRTQTGSPETTLETTQGQIDGFFSQLP